MLNSHREKKILNVTNVSITCTNIDVFKDTTNVWNALNVKKIRFTHFELNIHIANKEIRNLHVTYVSLIVKDIHLMRHKKLNAKNVKKVLRLFK